MNTHSIDSLSDDEIQVECLVRNIDFSNTIDWLDVLKGQLIAEEEDPSLTPAKTHATDVKTEYQLCYEQAVAFEKKIKDADSLEQLKSLNARIRHWIERTSRLKGCFRQDREVDQVITKWRTNRLLAEKQIEIYLNPTGGDLSLTNPGRLEFHLDPTLGNPNFVPTTKYVTNQSSPIRSKLSFSNSVTELKHPAQVYNTNTLATSTNMYDTVSMSTNYNQPRKMQTSTNTTQVNPNYPTATARVSNHAMPPVNQFQNNIVPYFEQQINRYNPKWNISFSGSPQDMDVTDFIFRLESHARRDRVSLTDLEAFLPRFLQGTAEKWYWSFAKKTPNATYNVFREAILSRFRSHVTEREMRRIVETRKQKPRESFHDFLLEMECLNSRLQCSFQDSEFLEIIRDNMDPALQSATLSSVIRSIDELRIICQRFEKLWQNSGHDPRQLTESKFRRTYNVNAIYQNPNNSVRLTENVEEISKSMPELPEPTQPYVEAFSNNPNVNKFSFRDKPNNESSKFLICWNCHDLAHRYQDCPIPMQRIFCFGCGKPDIIKPQCTYCQSKLLGNGRPVANKSGPLRPGNAVLNPNIPILRDDFRSIPKDAVALVGGPVILNCTPPRGIPEPSVLWYKDSKILDIAGKRLSMVDSGSLMISEVQASDAGKYECSAQSMAGSKTSPPAFLKVLAPPTVIKGPQDTEVIEGEGLDLPCELTGDPKPIVSWYRENGNLPEGRSRILLDNTLRIEETRPEDQGGYVCNGHNEGGNVTVAVELFVYATPTFLEAPADSEVKEGQTIKIPCRAQGRPQTRIVWDRVVWSMPNPGSGISNTNLQSSTTVTQEVSKIIEQDTHEELLAKAKIMSLRSKRNEVNKTSGIGSRVRRNVVVDLPEMKQIPELYVDPNNDRNKRDQDQNFLMSEFKLIMRNDNEDSYDTTFRKRKRRRRKRDVTNEGTSDTNGEKINDGSGNNLEEVEEDEDAEINENENENEDGLSVPTPTISLSTTSPMEQNTQLEISVNGELVIRDATEKDQGWYACAALNEAGSIVKKIYLRVVSASDTSGTTKVPDIPGSRWGSEQTIVISTITPISSSSLEVNWDITNEIVPSTILTLHYRSIEAAGTSNLGKDFQIVTTQLDLKEYTLTELKPHTEYEIFASVPSSLSGSVSNIRKGKTLDGPPSAPPTDVRVGVINNTAAYVRWSPPPTHLLNGELTGYRIQIKSNITNKLLGQMSLNATTQSVVINSLSPGGRYIARVAPFTAGGLGPYSPPAPLHMDPSFIARPPKSDPTSTGWNSAWMSGIALGILGICLVGGAIFAVFWARRNKRNMKASYPAGPILTTTIPDKQHTLWLHGNPMVVKTSHSLAPPAPPSSQGSEYAEVTNNMMPSMKMMNSNSTTTTTNTSTSAPPEPYATVTLKRGAGGVMNNNQGGLVLGPQSDDSCVKMCSNSPSSSEYNAPSREPLNLCDILPPPPDHPYGAYKPPNNMTIRTNPAAMSPQVMRRIPATPPRWGTLPPPIPNFPQNWMTQRTTRMTPHGTNDLNNHHQHYNHDFPHGYLGYHQNDDENDYESGSVLYEQCRQQQQQQQLDSYFNNGGEPTEEYYRNVNNMEYYDDSYEPSTPPPPCPDLNLYNNKNNLRLYQNNHNKNQLQQQQAPPQHQHQQQQNHPQYHQDPNMLNQKRIINRNIVGNIPNSIVINPNTNPNSLQISHQNGVVGMVVNGGSNGISNCVNGGASSSNTPSGQSSEEDSESDNNRWVPRSRRSRSRSKSSDRKYRNGGQMGQIR